MLTLYAADPRGLRVLPTPEATAAIPAELVWIDLLLPTLEEERLIERWIGVDVPTREEMREIETSSRLYQEDGALYMTILSLYNADAPHPETTDVTFILTGGRLVTVRHATPTPFERYAQRAPKAGAACRYGDFVLMGLVETFIDRIADVLERAGLEADEVSRSVFQGSGKRPMKTSDFKIVLAGIGRAGVIASKASESLMTVSRMLMFLAAAGKLSKESKASVKTAQRDVQQLLDHSVHLTDKTVFLLDAVTGLVNVEQNMIIKIFSVVAVTLMPPTLIGSIYGMNFAHMPELEVVWAYPAALAAMAVSAVLPYVLFRLKGWL